MTHAKFCKNPTKYKFVITHSVYPVFETYVNLSQKQIERYNTKYHFISAVDAVGTIYKDALVLIELDI